MNKALISTVVCCCKKCRRLLALQKVQKCSRIGESGSGPCSWKRDAECKERFSNLKYMGAQNFYMCKVQTDFTINSTFKRNTTRFLNHSCDLSQITLIFSLVLLIHARHILNKEGQKQYMYITLVCPAHDYKGFTVSTVGEEMQYNARLTKDEGFLLKLSNGLDAITIKKIVEEKSMVSGTNGRQYETIVFQHFAQPSMEQETLEWHVLLQAQSCHWTIITSTGSHQLPLYGGVPGLIAKNGRIDSIFVPLNLTISIRSRAYVLGKLVKPKFYRTIRCQVTLHGSQLGKPVNLQICRNCLT
ncbi:hypothetical protein POM88_001432 [Heracleum sosnowskyi]|uniref:Uncharacterized protein n=1 Tax=Heracleum sosnowskyi TaxID=360622 RepID=A0AAD8JCI0_9APIA|nr:hypothetical protein POM88_001432 [Heracleum sosnowskyi]